MNLCDKCEYPTIKVALRAESVTKGFGAWCGVCKCFCGEWLGEIKKEGLRNASR